MVRGFLTALALAVAGAAWAAEPVTGDVAVIDADTIRVNGVTIRLHGIDAPERDQTCRLDGRDWACGRWATDAARAAFEGARASCTPLSTDRHGRTVARCRVNGDDMADRIVRMGLAEAYLRYSRDYVDAEKEAALARRGIFASDFAAPEDHRAAARAATDQPPPGRCAIKGNITKNGRIYHMPGQEHYARTRISEGKGERWFCSEAEARAAGWRKARR
ncbi:thermonuclease family protein [Ovoidimarina sediminis]|uniref:thermonuclease family protein n=1 Tax=Ovoidimarina sediminis TaxID=3079856 RepID=UPI0029091641|nr:thermonuclease family protein [Rhodophyticola sp. MJ-SS7]MDU8945090.1 thermonuclease family protein [Rhodophyticola sp. MJ-SS7]